MPSVRGGDPDLGGGSPPSDALVRLLDGFRDVIWKGWEGKADRRREPPPLPHLPRRDGRHRARARRGRRLRRRAARSTTSTTRSSATGCAATAPADDARNDAGRARADPARALRRRLRLPRRRRRPRPTSPPARPSATSCAWSSPTAATSPTRCRPGMGDTVFAPFYEVLRARGVRFEFFTAATRLGVDPDEDLIAEVDLVRQAELEGSRSTCRSWTCTASPAGRRSPTGTSSPRDARRRRLRMRAEPARPRRCRRCCAARTSTTSCWASRSAAWTASSTSCVSVREPFDRGTRDGRHGAHAGVPAVARNTGPRARLEARAAHGGRAATSSRWTPTAT